MLKDTLNGYLMIGLMTALAIPQFGKSRTRPQVIVDTVSAKKEFVGIGPQFYDLPPEKTKEQLLEEEYDKKHANAEIIIKILEERHLLNALQQIGPSQPTMTANNELYTQNLEQSLLSSLQSYIQIGNLEMVSNLQNRLGVFYVQKKQYDQAISFFQRAFSLKEELNDVVSQVLVSNNIAVVYNFIGNDEEATSYYNLMNRKAIKSKDLNGQASSLEQLAILKAKKKLYLEAQLDIIKKVLPLYKRAKNASGRVGAYNNLAAIYLTEKKYTQSRWFHLQAVKIASISGNSNKDMSFSLYSLARVKKILKEYKLAIHDYTVAATYALEGGDDILRMHIYDDLGDIYIQTKDYANASASLAAYDMIKNKIISSTDYRKSEAVVVSGNTSPILALE
ncbi:tetratricopeptide repeat protein [Olivibacter domesticus]|uniref:Tetratricopeptide repeat-containing protein n=1 Tax=Olivibacter domesticus TaxID=407022 RepID=A0A1H7S360_OLID1|nr:tetratricopeptide repeat protein [Olivibacter domesticus]SEL66234.1 Tetratricopeptide repeat-containing protein [Olivibacter domesticus]